MKAILQLIWILAALVLIVLAVSGKASDTPHPLRAPTQVVDDGR